MTERQMRDYWHTSAELRDMVHVLLKRPSLFTPGGQVGLWPKYLPDKRLLRLFAISCSMEGWPDTEFVPAAEYIRLAYDWADHAQPPPSQSDPVWYALNPDLNLILEHIVTRFPNDSVRVSVPRMCELIRDICPDPWEPPALIDQYRTADVVAIAQECYVTAPETAGGRWRLDPVTLNVLADALEDVGVRAVEVVPCPRKCWDLYGVRVYGPIKVTGQVGNETIAPPKRCDCAGGLVTRAYPHPVVAALRDDRAHYRGFWPVDLVRGVQ